MIYNKYPDPRTQVLPRHVVVYKRGGVWLKYGSTYHPELAQTWYGALFNNNAFNHEGIRTLLVDDSDTATQRALDLLNGDT